MSQEDDSLPLTPELYLQWRNPRHGDANPTRLTNPVWTWIARQPELSAYAANARFGGPSSLSAGPAWCNQRFGQSRTTLADGRVIAIAGEHEDSYDADFFIYNDVIVTLPSGAIEIYGYPKDVLPPTDFHSATLVGERIWIVGCLGYQAERGVGATPVFTLDTTSFVIERIVSDGDSPGWIYGHRAHLGEDGRMIVVSGGKRTIIVGDGQELRDNGDDWSLDLTTRRWTQLTHRRWQQWELRRSDGKRNQLFTIWGMSWHVGRDQPFDREQRAKHLAELGREPDFALYRARYAPPLAHRDVTPEDAQAMSTHLEVDGIVVRYVEESFAVKVTIEGPLDDAKVRALIDDAAAKLTVLDAAPYVSSRLY